MRLSSKLFYKMRSVEYPTCACSGGGTCSNVGRSSGAALKHACIVSVYVKGTLAGISGN